MKYICLQENDYDCGLACIKMMLAHFHKNKKMLDLDKEIVNSKYSMLQLKNYALKYNLLTEGGVFENKEDIFEYKDCLVHVLINEKHHYMIYEKSTKKFVYLIDPTIGRIKLPKAEFISIFSGICLMKKEVIPFGNKLKFKKDYNLNYILVYSIFLILDFALFYIISFLSNNSKYLFHSILIILAILLSILSKLKLINRHQKMIDNNLNDIFKKSNNLSVSTKKGLLSYKLYTIKHFYGFLNNLFLVTFTIFILINNGFYNVFFIIIAILICFISTKINQLNENSDRYFLRKLEYQFYKDSKTWR